MFWSETGSGFEGPGSIPLPRIPRRNPLSLPPGTRCRKLLNRGVFLDVTYSFFTCMTASKSRLVLVLPTNHRAPALPRQRAKVDSQLCPHPSIWLKPTFILSFFLSFLLVVLLLACVQTTQAVFFPIFVIALECRRRLQAGYPPFVAPRVDAQKGNTQVMRDTRI